MELFNSVKKMIMRVVTLVMAFFAMNFCNAQSKSIKLKQNKDGNTLLWQISGNGLKHPSYLFGTFHLLCKEDIHFSDQLKAAVTAAKEIYMELDMDDPNTMLEGLKFMYMNDNKKLKDFYTDSEYNRVENYFKDSAHMPINMMENVKPYFLMSLLYPQILNCKTTSGIEEQLVQLAKQKNKQIQGLETIEFQASVFDSIPYADQAKELLNSIDSMSYYKDEFNAMLAVYKSQKLKEMENLFNKSEFGVDGHEDLLLYDRNRKWVSHLKTIMSKESVFVAVGAGHLLGEKGLISLLKKAGYNVIPLLNK